MTPAKRVADNQQAALLMDPQMRQIVALLSQPHSIQEVADHFHFPANRAQYLMTKLVRAGIAELASVTPRAGRPIKRYRVAPVWFIPFQVTEAASLEQLGLEQWIPRIKGILQDAALNFREQDDGRSGYWLQDGELWLGNAEGVYSMEQLVEPVLIHLTHLTLSMEQARSLQHRLLAVLSEFEREQSPTAQRFSLGLTLVRERPERTKEG